jgi:hypothetical protein
MRREAETGHEGAFARTVSRMFRCRLHNQSTVVRKRRTQTGHPPNPLPRGTAPHFMLMVGNTRSLFSKRSICDDSKEERDCTFDLSSRLCPCCCCARLRRVAKIHLTPLSSILFKDAHDERRDQQFDAFST